MRNKIEERIKNKTYNKRKVLVVFLCAAFVLFCLIGRLVYLMIFDAEYYQNMAEELHEREREIKAARGEIVDRNGVVLATNRTVCTISVIHSQIKDPQQTADMLSKELELDREDVLKKVEKVSSMEKIKTNVDKKTGDRIREYNLPGVKVDEDFKRYYPYDRLASRVLGFTGSDNQGIIGLEVKYEDVLKGTNGKILTVTDARGIELEGVAEDRIEPVAGNTLKTSLDYNIQSYCEQAAEKVLEEKQAEGVSVLLMNPQNGEIYAMVNVPEFNLNEPYRLNDKTEDQMTDEERQNRLNQMWRNRCINDTYELANEITPEPVALGQSLNQLSGGQSRALMIADIALLCDSPIVLIDEIENAGIDKERALGLLQRHDKLVLVVTHDPHTALMSRRRIVMGGGAVAAVVERSPQEAALYMELGELYRRQQTYQASLRRGDHLA